MDGYFSTTAGCEECASARANQTKCCLANFRIADDTSPNPDHHFPERPFWIIVPGAAPTGQFCRSSFCACAHSVLQHIEPVEHNVDLSGGPSLLRFFDEDKLLSVGHDIEVVSGQKVIALKHLLRRAG